MDRIEVHTGGVFQTNAYAVPSPTGKWLLIDAPEGVVRWAQGRGWDVAGLLLTLHSGLLELASHEWSADAALWLNVANAGGPSSWQRIGGVLA
jgi:hypothetical protein